jgi:phosphatidate cytidylyltransferase
MSFLKRLLSALIMGPIVIVALYQGGIIFQSLVGLLIVIAIYEFWSLSKNEVKRRWKLSVLVFGILYSIAAYFALTDLRDVYGFVFTGLIIIGVWASDIGAYIFGKLIGGRKLCPSISPNKTWAGLIGACLFPSFILDGYLAFFANNLTARETVLWSLGTSLVIGLLGQAGDLFISLLKRRVGLKDTGKLIPGHGGILDRIDALMLVVIAVWILLTLKVVIWDMNLLVF